VSEVIRRYLAAHDRRDTDAALATFTPDATVVDDGHEYVGSDEIRHWLANASTEFTYTRTFVDAEVVDADTWLVTNRLEGNFPGNVVDLRYRFALTGDLISQLVIAP
jgi:ketosteroid isomerase-like protein